MLTVAVRWLLSLLPLLLVACAAGSSDPAVSTVVVNTPVKTGAALLQESEFAQLNGKRVGLIVNHTAMVDSVHLVDLVHRAPDVELVALFGPEHGIRGTADAGARIADGRDEQTGVPVFSLYGDTRRPTPQMLDGIDALVFDIQDVGSRFYTYISTMGLAMQSAAEAGIEFIVLDRPNPLGGQYVSGFVLEPEYTSFVGQYPIPTVHGLTVGELAHMIKSEQMLPGLADLTLRVIAMENWTRATLWPDAGLEWNPPSPNIPDFETAVIYAGTCLFEAASASEGRGTYEPFKLLGAPFGDAQEFARRLNGADLPGVRFAPERFTPRSIEGMSSHPKLLGEDLEGIRIEVTDLDAFRPVEAGIHILHAFFDAAPDKAAFIARPAAMDRLAGTDRLRNMLMDGSAPEEIISAWQDELAAFDTLRQRYFLY